MYKTNSQLKQEAKQALSGKWGIAVLMSLLTGIVVYSLSLGDTESIAVTITSFIGTLLNIILNVGFLSFLLKICCGQKDLATFKDLFFGFQCHPGKALLLYLLNVLYILPGTFIYIILLVVFMFAMMASSGASINAMLYSSIEMEPAMLIAFLVVFILLTILYFIYAVYIGTTYGLIYYLLLDYPDLSVGQIWKRSAQLMKGHRLRKVKLELSFIPWIIASIFTLFIGMLWLNVYMNATFTEFYLDLVQQQAYKAQPSTIPNQTTTYTASNITVDTSLTHDCEETHSNTFENHDNNYSGIDPDTFK